MRTVAAGAGADRTIEFEVTEGVIDGTFVAHLLEHAGRPVASAVLPAGLGEPTVRIAAKHLRGRKGTHGALAIYPSGLAYETPTEGGSRYWRIADVEAVLRTSPRTLLIDVYERGRVRPFAFELKEPLPDAAFEALWQQVNPPAARTGLPTEARSPLGLPAEAPTDVTRAKVEADDEAARVVHTGLLAATAVASALFRIVRLEGKQDALGAIEAWTELLAKNPGYPEADKVKRLIAEAQQKIVAPAASRTR
jgi:hypothetical protein